MASTDPWLATPPMGLKRYRTGEEQNCVVYFRTLGADNKLAQRLPDVDPSQTALHKQRAENRLRVAGGSVADEENASNNGWGFS